MLIAALRGGLYGQTLQQVPELTSGQIAEITGGEGMVRAGKITRTTAMVELAGLTAEEVLTKARVLGSVWDEESYGVLTGSGERKRIVYERFERVDESKGLLFEEEKPRMVIREGGLMVRTCDGVWLECVKCTVDGGKKGEGVREMERERRRMERRRGEETWRVPEIVVEKTNGMKA